MIEEQLFQSAAGPLRPAEVGMNTLAAEQSVPQVATTTGRPVIVFLHIPKTAGTTFRFILENTLGVSNCHSNQTKREVFRQADVDFARKLFPRLRAIAGHNLVDPLQLSIPGAFYMTFLRDPVMRVISNYQDGVLRGGKQETFEQVL